MTVRTSAPSALACIRRTPEPGTRSASPKVVKIAWAFGQRHAIVDPPHRQNADGQPGLHLVDFLGQHCFRPIAEDRMGVPAADLHDLRRPGAAVSIRPTGAISANRALAFSGSRNSSTYFMGPRTTRRSARPVRRPTACAQGPTGYGRWLRGIPGLDGCCPSAPPGNGRRRRFRHGAAVHAGQGDRGQAPLLGFFERGHQVVGVAAGRDPDQPSPARASAAIWRR